MPSRAAGRRILVVAAVAAAIAAAAAGVAAWWRWLSRRQASWRVRLAEAIPVNSAYWRTRAARDDGDAGGAERDLVYVAVGDSAAQGIGASRPAHGYVGVLARELELRSGRRVRVHNLAISGATLRIAIDRELPALARLEPDVLTVSIGANDIADFEPGRFARELRELFAALPAHAIVADLPSFYFLPAQRRVRLANRILRAAAAEHGLELVPLHALTDRQSLWGVATQFAGDLFHPNDRGYRVWAAAFRPAVERRLAAIGMLRPPASVIGGNTPPVAE